MSMNQAEIRRKLFEETEQHLQRHLASRASPNGLTRRHASIGELGGSSGLLCHAALCVPSSPLPSPRSVQASATSSPRRSYSIADLGAEGSGYTPSMRTRDACRFHEPSGQGRAPLTPRTAQVSYQVQEQMRFAEPPSTDRVHRLSRARVEESPRGLCVLAAGTTSSRCRLIAQATTTSRARSATPEYYDRYATNAGGTSLPGASDVVPLTPRVRNAELAKSRIVIWQPSASKHAQDACRFHGHQDPHKSPVQKQAFNLSSSQLPRPSTTSLSARPLHVRGSQRAAWH